MARIKTIAVVDKPVKDGNGRFLDKDGGVIPENDSDTPRAMVKEEYYLLHWGKETTIMYNNDGSAFPVENTMAICQHIKTGYIETFFPIQLRVIEKEIKV